MAQAVFTVSWAVAIGGMAIEFVAVTLRVTGRIRSRRMLDLISIGGTLFFVGLVLASIAAAITEET